MKKKEKLLLGSYYKRKYEMFNNIEVVPLKENDIYEIDTLNELKELDKSYINILENKVKTAVVLAAGDHMDLNIQVV